MTDDLLSRLKAFEERLDFRKDKAISYVAQMKSSNPTIMQEIAITSGEISAYNDIKDLLYEHFPELKTESGQGASQ